MRDRSRSVWPHAFVWVAGFIVTTSVLVVLARATITWPKPCPGFVCYWSAATLLAHGQNPYDLALLSRIQKENGWDKLTDGFGFFFLVPVRSGLPNHVWFFWIPLTLALSWFLPRFPPRDPRRMPAQAAVRPPPR